MHSPTIYVYPYFFSERQKSMIRLTHPFYHLCIVSMHLIMNIAEIMLAGCSAIINQSIICNNDIVLVNKI
jgi:hypothetical protein